MVGLAMFTRQTALNARVDGGDVIDLRHAACVPYVEFFVTDDAHFTESIKLAQSVDAERTNSAVMNAAEFAVFLKSP
jgi:hypothetical protein